MVDANDAPPEIAFRQVSVERGERPANWQVEWDVRNVGPQPMRLLSVRLPHGQFKSEELQLDPKFVLNP